MKKLLLPFAASALFLIGQAHSQIFFDVNGSTAGFGNYALVSQTWNATNTNWTTVAAGDVATIPWNGTNGTTTFTRSTGETFTSATVNVEGNFTLSGLSKSNSGWSLVLTSASGSNSLTFNPSSFITVVGNQLQFNLTEIYGSFTKNGSGVLLLNNNPATVSANITIAEGPLDLRHPTRASTSNFTVNGGSFVISTASATIQNLSGSGGNITTSTGALNINLTTNQTVNGTYAGDILPHANAGFQFGLTKNGTATLTLTGNNSYNGNVVVNAGILQIGNATTTGNLAAGTNTTNNATLVFNRSNAYGYNGVISGSGVVSQNGTSVLTLSGNNTYTGATNVNAGTLLITGNSIAANGTVNVANGATLGGNGSLGGPVTIANGGILAPGTSPGTLTLNNTLTLNPSSILNWEIDIADQTVGGGINDLVTGVTNLTLDGTINFSLIGGPSITSTGTWRLFNYTGSLTNNTLDIGTLALGTGLTASIDTSVTGQVNLSVIPEPATWALLAGALTTLVIFPRRRHA